MNEKKVIEKLSLLKSIQPDSRTLGSIRQRIPTEDAEDKNFFFRKWFTLPILAPIIAIACIVIMLTVSMINVSQLITTAKIVFASNHYEKAKIAVADTDEQFVAFKKNPSVEKINSLSKSLALANTEMNGLKLVGEKGKYTMQDCLSLYSSYHSSLEIMKKTVSSQNNSLQDKQLLLEIKQFDEQSEKKLHTYKE